MDQRIEAFRLTFWRSFGRKAFPPEPRVSFRPSEPRPSPPRPGLSFAHHSVRGFKYSIGGRLRNTRSLRLGSVPNSAKYRRYAEVARKLAKQQHGSDGFMMWTQLAALWDEVAERMAAKEARSASGKHQR
jgi:hypothetical protein